LTLSAGSKIVSAEQMKLSRLLAELARVTVERDTLGWGNRRLV
jgi:hypothetical protein